jgi:trehalose 6-phosphate synthase/phosphatase
MNRLLLVSNRLPVTLSLGPHGVRVERSVGGLATGLRESHERSGGLWIGWPGSMEFDSDVTRARVESRFATLGIVPVYLSAREVRRYYEGFANSVIWPLFHYMTGPLPLRSEGWDAYVTANERFAAAVVEHYRPGDQIWVHDYQLLLLPSMIRRQLPDARIGFFLHIPFPSSELFATLPNREEMLEGLLGADLIGFHAQSYMRHFAYTLVRLLGVDLEEDSVHYEGRCIRLGAFPMGVDARALAARAIAADVAENVEDLRADSPGKLLVGIDRLDYTKGIPRRLLAFEELLRNKPEWHGRVRLLQVAVPSRTGLRSYRKFREEVDGLVGHINGAFGTAHWVPVHYMYRSVPEPQLLGCYRAADALLVTPVRDGMNLVAKEFVAVRNDEDGVLVLSEFAGAAAELQDALLVNPYDVEGTAEAYHRALTMSRSERRDRMRALRARVFGHDVHAWAASFLHTLAESAEVAAQPAAPRAKDAARPPQPAVEEEEGLPPNAIQSWSQLVSSLEEQRPVLFLDYDGTLTPIVLRPDEADLPRHIRMLLKRLSEAMPIAVISGRARDDLRDRVGLRNLIYAGSHGFDISGPDGLKHEVGAEYLYALHQAAQELRQLTEGIAGAVIEEKRFSLAIHYRLVGRGDIPRMIAAVDEVVRTHSGLEKRYGKKVIELRPSADWDKGCAVMWILEALEMDHAAVVPIYVGDDLTDEDAFAALEERGIGILVATAPRPTHAQYSLRNVHEVRAFLERLAQHFAAKPSNRLLRLVGKVLSKTD